MKEVGLSAFIFITLALAGPLAWIGLKLTESELGSLYHSSRFGALYKGFAVSSGYRYSFNVVFLLRRFLYALTLVTLRNVSVVQILFQLMMS